MTSFHKIRSAGSTEVQYIFGVGCRGYQEWDLTEDKLYMTVMVYVLKESCKAIATPTDTIHFTCADRNLRIR